MFKKSILSSSLALALVAPSFVMAEIEATVELKNETAIFTSNGQTIGQATSMVDDITDHHDVMKFQNQVNIFLNGDIGEESSW
ncbi:MAG: RNA polymerase-associated protein rapA, partial [Gammaproteobacteria bacterium]|nr:RNA polymerase-associated protein rapA [Gammaproteobacteria bacterium]